MKIRWILIGIIVFSGAVVSGYGILNALTSQTLDEKTTEFSDNSNYQGGGGVTSQTISDETAFEQVGSGLDITLTIHNQQFLAKLEDTDASLAFVEQLPLVLEMSDLNSNEKYDYLDFTLPTQSQNPKQIQTGDIMLYGNDCLVLFYESFVTSYRYTKLGSIVEAEAFSKAVGSGEVRILIEQKID